MRRRRTRIEGRPRFADDRLADDAGQAVPLMAGLVGVAAMVTVAVAGLAGDVVDAQRARTAADAAALAAVDGGRPAADRFADAHGGALVEWSQHGAEVTVTVRVGDAVATARATGGAAALTSG